MLAQLAQRVAHSETDDSADGRFLPARQADELGVLLFAYKAGYPDGVLHQR